jgi:hypothetical protein
VGPGTEEAGLDHLSYQPQQAAGDVAQGDNTGCLRDLDVSL